eukprot:TRINITY_DN5273_c0_g1_i1.p1 TRINITY_DN5273_c0_g1~~TRINITY_DN5273_c0_g1_i1.p1  ORF type:complete len:337 (-),score=59.82 TRINITY_DN5273_c0_g1_i1:203-1213(-)
MRSLEQLCLRTICQSLEEFQSFGTEVPTQILQDVWSSLIGFLSERSTILRLRPEHIRLFLDAGMENLDISGTLQQKRVLGLKDIAPDTKIQNPLQNLLNLTINCQSRLRSINLSRNKSVEELYLQDLPQLETLDVTSCSNLSHLFVSSSPSLANVYFAENYALQEILLDAPQLESLDLLLESSALISLTISSNKLQELHLENKPELVSLSLRTPLISVTKIHGLGELNNIETMDLQLEADTALVFPFFGSKLKDFRITSVTATSIQLSQCKFLEAVEIHAPNLQELTFIKCAFAFVHDPILETDDCRSLKRVVLSDCKHLPSSWKSKMEDIIQLEL